MLKQFLCETKTELIDVLKESYSCFEVSTYRAWRLQANCLATKSIRAVVPHQITLTRETHLAIVGEQLKERFPETINSGGISGKQGGRGGGVGPGALNLNIPTSPKD